MIVKVLAAIGVGTLAILAFWGFLLVAVPTVPTQPQAEKIGPGVSARDPKVRDVTEQPHTAAIPRTQPAAPPKPAAQATAAPARAAEPAAAPSTIEASPSVSPKEPATTQTASGQAGEPADAAQPTPSGRQRRAANCTRYRTYNAATQSYRGFDGVVHPCRP